MKRPCVNHLIKTPVGSHAGWRALYAGSWKIVICTRAAYAQVRQTDMHRIPGVYVAWRGRSIYFGFTIRGVKRLSKHHNMPDWDKLCFITNRDFVLDKQTGNNIEYALTQVYLARGSAPENRKLEIPVWTSEIGRTTLAFLTEVLSNRHRVVWKTLGFDHPRDLAAIERVIELSTASIMNWEQRQLELDSL